MSGFVVDGRCYPTTAEAVQAVTTWLPSAKSSGVCYFAAPGDYPAASGEVVNARLTCLDVATGATSAQSLAWALPHCEQGFADYGGEYLLFVLALAFAVFSGFRTGYRP